MVDDRISRQEPVRIVATVSPAREPYRPVGRDETEAVPAPAPRLPDQAALQHDVVHSRPDQVAAEREPGLAGSDHGDIDDVAHLDSRSAERSGSRIASWAAPSGS